MLHICNRGGHYGGQLGERGWLPQSAGLRLYMPEVEAWWRITWTAGLSTLLRGALPFIDVSFLGHLGTDALSAASLANIWIQMSTMWLFSGQEETISTLVSQAWGHGNKRLAGAWLQLAVLVLLALSAAVGVTWAVSGRILAGLGFQPASLTSQAQLFCQWYLLSLVPLGLLSAIQAWLNAMGSTLPAIGTALAAMAVSIPANYFLIFGTKAIGGTWAGLGFIGSPLSTGLVNIVGLAVLVAIVVRWRLHDGTVSSFHTDLVFNRKHAGNFLEQALPNFIGMSLETLQLQLLSSIAAQLGDVPLSVHNSMLNLFMIVAALMMGAMRGASVRVGYSLGAGRVDLAKQTGWVSLVVLGAIAAVVSLLLFFLRWQVPLMFSNDPAVIELTASVLPIAALALLIFSVEFAAMGVLMGQARPLPVTAAAMAGNWLVCIPMAYTLTRKTTLGLHGVWWALTAGYTVCTVITVVVLARTDWEQCMRDAVARSESAKAEDSEGPALDKDTQEEPLLQAQP